MKISRETFQKLRDEYGFEGLRDDYSGRGMFGETCLSITGNVCDLLQFTAALVTEFDGTRDVIGGMLSYVNEIIEELASCARQDSMGLDTVYYFTGVTVGE